MGFDELNILNGNTAFGSGSAGVSGGSGFDFELPEYDFLGNAVSKQIDEVTQKLKNALPWILAIGAGFAAWKLGPKLGLDLQKTIGLAVGIFGAVHSKAAQHQFDFPVFGQFDDVAKLLGAAGNAADLRRENGISGLYNIQQLRQLCPVCFHAAFVFQIDGFVGSTLLLQFPHLSVNILLPLVG